MSTRFLWSIVDNVRGAVQSIRREIKEIVAPNAWLVEMLEFLKGNMTGHWYYLPKIIPIRSALANQILNESTDWCIPFVTTEVSTRIVSLKRRNGKSKHVIVWDERFSQYLFNFVQGYEAWVRNRPNMDVAVRAFSGIALNFVTEQLFMENRLIVRSPDPERAEKVLAQIYAYRKETQHTYFRVLEDLLTSPEMSDPGIHNLISNTWLICRSLSLDHEVNHFIRRHPDKWDKYSSIKMAETEHYILQHLEGFGKFVEYGSLPPGEVWPFFQTIFQQVPWFYVKDLTGTAKGEEIQSDLVSLMMVLRDLKTEVKELSEYEEFKLIATLYQASRVWQITVAFLQGLRLEVAKSVGWEVSEREFQDSDLGLRLMLGNFLTYMLLCNPPYSERMIPKKQASDPFAKEIQKWRVIAASYPSEGLRIVSGVDAASGHYRENPQVLEQVLHRSLFLEQYERSIQHWVCVLNEVGLRVAEKLQIAARPEGRIPPMPSPDEYLNIIGFPRNKG